MPLHSNASIKRCGNSSSTFSSTDPKSLVEIYSVVLDLRNQLDVCLDSFETGEDKSVACQQRLAALTNQFNQKLQKFKTIFASQASCLSHSEAAVWKRRLCKLEDDGESFRKSVDKQFGYIYKTRKQEQERNKLISDTNDHEKRAIRGYAQERDAVRESHTLIDSITEQGRIVRDQIVSQNKALKGARRKMLDIGSSLGVSSSLLGLISRRHAVDRWITYGCMIFTILTFICLYSYMRTGKLLSWAPLVGYESGTATSEVVTAAAKQGQEGNI